MDLEAVLQADGVDPVPPEAAHRALVDRPALYALDLVGHAARHVAVVQLGRSVVRRGLDAALDRLVRLDVVRRGEPAGADEADDRLHAQGAGVRVLVAGHQLPGAYVGLVGRHGFQLPDRQALDVEQQQVGEHEQDVALVGHVMCPFLAQPLGHLGSVGLGAHPLGLAEARFPLHADPAAVPGEDQQPVAVAEVVGVLVVVGDGVAALAQVAHERVVGRREVVSVHRVFDGEFPVAPHAVLLGAGQGGHAADVLLFDHRHVVGGIAEVFEQRRNVRVEGDEDESLVDLQARYATQPHGRLELVGRLVGVGVRDRGEVTVVAECPGVVEALEEPGRALALTAQHGAAVRAGVQEGVHLAGGVPAEDERPAPEGADLEVVGVGDLGLVAEVEPGVCPHPAAFPGEDLRAAVGLAVDPESEQVPVLDDHRFWDGPGVASHYGVCLSQVPTRAACCETPSRMSHQLRLAHATLSSNRLLVDTLGLHGHHPFHVPH